LLRQAGFLFVRPDEPHQQPLGDQFQSLQPGWQRWIRDELNGTSKKIGVSGSMTDSQLLLNQVAVEAQIVALFCFRYDDHDGGCYALDNLGSRPWSALHGIRFLAGD
jgi:hypothetical protein